MARAPRSQSLLSIANPSGFRIHGGHEGLAYSNSHSPRNEALRKKSSNPPQSMRVKRDVPTSEGTKTKSSESP